MGFSSFARKRSRGKNAASMRNIERRCAIRVSLREKNFAFAHGAIHVKDAARNELLQQIGGLIVAQLLKPRPKLLLRVNFLHPDAGSLRTRLQQPGPRNTR